MLACIKPMWEAAVGEVLMCGRDVWERAGQYFTLYTETTKKERPFNGPIEC